MIVLVGSKGGFVLKKAPAPNDRETFQADGVACYQLFVRAMLEITDNLVDGDVVSPQRVVRKDDADPYLVVAADKGTTTFSNIANEIAVSLGHSRREDPLATNIRAWASLHAPLPSFEKRFDCGRYGWRSRLSTTRHRP